MSAHIPEHRRVIHGRTWSQEWQPCAVEHYRRPSYGLRKVGTCAMWLLMLALAYLIWSNSK